MKIIKKLSFPTYIQILLLVAYMLMGCTSPDYPSSIDLTKKQNVSLFDVFSGVRVIKLETIQDNLINDISKVRYFDSRYFILDERSQQIFCFNESGNFVYKINAQGRGKGEYHHITDLAIDEKNKQLVVLDPVVQRVHFFDLNGNFLSSHDIKTDKVPGLNRVYPLQDSILLLISLTYENLQFYSLKEEKIIYADFEYDVPSTLHTFSPYDHVYFYDNKVLFLAPLSRELVDVTAMIPEPYFAWCFGPDNNSDQQINRVLEEIRIKQQIPEYITLPHMVVGKGRILNHQIMKPYENKRFRIAALEFDDDFHFVIIDKVKNQTVVFTSFEEGVILPFRFMQSDKAITYYQPETTTAEMEIMEKRGLLDFYLSRNFKQYLPEILHENCRKIVENHNPMTDNPFLVVYKFKE